MSTAAERIREVIEAEEAALEAEQDGDAVEPETGDQLEPVDIGNAPLAPDPEPASTGLDPKAVEEAFKKIDTRGKSYIEAIQKLLVGVDVPLSVCPCCQIPGFVLPFDEYDPGENARKDAVLKYFGDAEDDLVQHPTMERCEPCKGRGKMKTGAVDPQNSWALCWQCHGKGYRDLTMPAPQPPVPAPPVQTFTPAVVPAWQPPAPAAPPAEVLNAPQGWHANGKPGADTWDRWPGHPRYGIDPANTGGVW
jgi:hypothetical protein